MHPLLDSIDVELAKPDVADEDEGVQNPHHDEGAQHGPESPGAIRVIGVGFVEENCEGVDEGDQGEDDGVKDVVYHFKITVDACAPQPQVQGNKQDLAPGQYLG